MKHELLQIKTADGVCPTHMYHPDGEGPWPGVITFMDAIGMRPAMMEIAERIASNGYYVLLPDLFYRVEFDTSHGAGVFADPALKEDLFTRVVPSAKPANVARDMEAWLAHLDASPLVKKGGIGMNGYCMGGRLALCMTGMFGDRIAATATYHAGGVATDSPESPHLLAPRMKARVYVAGAIEDRSFDEAQKERLEKALTDAGVEHTIETYQARHGFVPRDTPEHNEAAERRHWETLLALFGEELA